MPILTVRIERLRRVSEQGAGQPRGQHDSRAEEAIMARTIAEFRPAATLRQRASDRPNRGW